MRQKGNLRDSKKEIARLKKKGNLKFRAKNQKRKSTSLKKYFDIGNVKIRASDRYWLIS